ncbi:MAG: alpha/beta hydrolase-fold protein [Vicinamibacterales bacterium]
MLRAGMTVVITMTLTSFGTFAAVDYMRGRAVPSPYLVPHDVRSDVLGERRQLLVRLPETYHRALDRRYPVAFVLDGSALDIPTADSAALMARLALTPELIVVGIPNVSAEGRQRDYTPPFMRQDIDRADSAFGAGDRFLDFLEREVVPLVERVYRSDGHRVLIGHSRGGLLVTYALIARPTMFDAFLAHSPALWRDDFAAVASLAEWLPRQSRLSKFYYMSVGGDEVPQMKDGYARARAVLEQHAEAAGLRWHADVVEGADHQSNRERAAPLGLRAAFHAPLGNTPRDGSAAVARE